MPNYYCYYRQREQQLDEVVVVAVGPFDSGAGVAWSEVLAYLHRHYPVFHLEQVRIADLMTMVQVRHNPLVAERAVVSSPILFLHY